MPTTTRPTPEAITAATLKALASGAFEPGRLERAMWLALDPRSVVIVGEFGIDLVDIPCKTLGFIMFRVICNRVMWCECADMTEWCKHRIAAALMVRALEAQNAATAAQDALPTQAPATEPERPTVPALAPVIPPSEWIVTTEQPCQDCEKATKRRKAKTHKPTAASVEVPPGGIREFKSTMTPEERARAMKALWG